MIFFGPMKISSVFSDIFSGYWGKLQKKVVPGCRMGKSYGHMVDSYETKISGKINVTQISHKIDLFRIFRKLCK